MDLSNQIKTFLPSSGSVRKTGDHTYEISFPVPGVNPCSWVEQCLPEAIKINHWADSSLNASYCKFRLYELRLHRPTKYEIYGIVCWLKIYNPDYSYGIEQKNINHVNPPLIKKEPVEIAGDRIAEQLYSVPSIQAQIEIVRSLCDGKVFADVEDYFDSLIKRFSDFSGVRKHLQKLGVEPSDEEADTFFDIPC